MGLAYKNLSYVEPDLLARVVNKVEKAEWCFNTTITSEQAQVVFGHMRQKTNLKELQMINKNLLNFLPESLGSAVNNVENLWMADGANGHTFTPEQVNGVFMVMSAGTKVKELVLRDVNISLIEPSAIALAVSRLEELMIWRTHGPGQTELSALQAKALFKTLSKKTKLKRLLILTRNMIYIEPIVLAKALNNLEEVYLFQGMLTDVQGRTLFNIMTKKTFLQKLTIIYNNLSTVQPGILAKGISQLQELTLVHCRLTSEQTLAVFSAINEGS